MFASLYLLLAAFMVEPVQATQTLKAGDVLHAGDLAYVADGSIAVEHEFLGQALIRTAYAGQEVRRDNIRPAILVKRNQMVTLRYVRGALEITTMGRALSQGSAGDVITVLNLQSKQTVQGVIDSAGWVLVS